jgi:hypothetical protein
MRERDDVGVTSPPPRAVAVGVATVSWRRHTDDCASHRAGPKTVPEARERGETRVA